MQSNYQNFSLTPYEQTIQMLHDLNCPIHRIGYRHLSEAIPYFAQSSSQSLSKEVYPKVAERFGNMDSRAVEHSIRSTILDAWNHRDPIMWRIYFPHAERVPSNKLFISPLAERLRFPAPYGTTVLHQNVI